MALVRPQRTDVAPTTGSGTDLYGRSSLGSANSSGLSSYQTNVQFVLKSQELVNFVVPKRTIVRRKVL
eukprot:3261848-Rhodomonas_salina.1